MAGYGEHNIFTMQWAQYALKCDEFFENRSRGAINPCRMTEVTDTGSKIALTII